MAKDLVDLVIAKPAKRNAKRKRTGKEKFWLVFRYVSLIFIWFLVVMPIYVMVINSLKGVKNVYLTNAFKLPEKLDFFSLVSCVEWNRLLPAVDIRFNEQDLVFCNSIINYLCDYWLNQWICFC